VKVVEPVFLPPPISVMSWLKGRGLICFVGGKNEIPRKGIGALLIQFPHIAFDSNSEQKNLCVGRIDRGILFLVVGFLAKIPLGGVIGSFPIAAFSGGSGALLGALILLALLNLGLWIWQIYDAYTLAKKYNAEVEHRGKLPW